MKEKVGTWLNQLPKNYRYDNSYSSSVDDNESVKGKRNKDDANGSNVEAIAQETCSWDPMKYDYITPANCKPFFGNFDDDLVDKREQRLCRFYRSNGWCSYQKNWYLLSKITLVICVMINYFITAAFSTFKQEAVSCFMNSMMTTLCENLWLLFQLSLKKKMRRQ